MKLIGIIFMATLLGTFARSLDQSPSQKSVYPGRVGQMREAAYESGDPIAIRLAEAAMKHEMDKEIDEAYPIRVNMGDRVLDLNEKSTQKKPIQRKLSSDVAACLGAHPLLRDVRYVEGRGIFGYLRQMMGREKNLTQTVQEVAANKGTIDDAKKSIEAHQNYQRQPKYVQELLMHNLITALQECQ